MPGTSNNFSPIKMASHIILTGFMGVGKTTVGQLLANRLGRPLIDTDQKLEEQTGMPVGPYIRRFGLQAFRRWENRLLNLAFGSESAVIATGGGAVLSSLNRKRMLQHGW